MWGGVVRKKGVAWGWQEEGWEMMRAEQEGGLCGGPCGRGEGVER